MAWKRLLPVVNNNTVHDKEMQMRCTGRFVVVVLALLVVLVGTSAMARARMKGSFQDNQRDGLEALHLQTTPRLGLSNTFPTLPETVEMASLSHLIYRFRKYENDTTVCDEVEQASNCTCHWYHHNRDGGTQVMIVTSSQDDIVIVFAGTDDLRTFLTDADIVTKPFGNKNQPQTHLPDPRVQVHAGFDNAVFGNGIFGNITQYVTDLLARHKYRRIITTGHSLGGADAILTAIGLNLHHHDMEILSLSFGCPHIGYSSWCDFVHMNTVAVGSNIGIWRVVLGWDLVPRLPEFMMHVGHTIQIHPHNHTDNPALAYYHHVGDAKLGYAGVPFGWEAKPFIWVPGALWSHSIRRYHSVLDDYEKSGASWVDDFVHVSADDDYEPPSSVDDDFVGPPDDDVKAVE